MEALKTGFDPERIGRLINLKLSWQKHPFRQDEIALETDPGIAICTGAHPTTSLCIDMMERYIQRGDKVLDVGTGTGILMIAAAKLGARQLLGIDKSKIAVEIASRNLILNGIEKNRFNVRVGHLLNGIDEQFDLIVANILTETLLVLLDDIESVLTENGVFICSGMLEGNTHRVVSKMKALGLEILDTCVRQNWVSIAGKQKGGV